MGFSLATIVSYTKKLLQYTHTIKAYELHQKDYEELKEHLLRETNILYQQYITSTKQLADHRFRMRQLQRVHQHLNNLEAKKQQPIEEVTTSRIYKEVQKEEHNEKEEKKSVKYGRNKISDNQQSRTRITKFNNEAAHKDANLKAQQATSKPKEKDTENFEKILGPITQYQIDSAQHHIQEALLVLRSLLIQLWQQIIINVEDDEDEGFESVQLFSKSRRQHEENAISITLKAKLAFWIDTVMEYNQLCGDIIKLEESETHKRILNHYIIAWEELLYRAADARITTTYKTNLPTSQYGYVPETKNGTFYQKLTTTDKLRCPTHVTYTFEKEHPQEGATTKQTHTYVKKLCDGEYKFFATITQFMMKKMKTQHIMPLLSLWVRSKKPYAHIANIETTPWTQPRTVYSNQPKHIYYIYFVEQVERTIHQGVYMLPTTLFNHMEAYETAHIIDIEAKMNPSLQQFFKQIQRPIRIPPQPDTVAPHSDTRICSILWLRAFQDIVMDVVKHRGAFFMGHSPNSYHHNDFLMLSIATRYHLLSDPVGLSYLSPLLTYLVNVIYSQFIFQCHFPKLSLLSMYHSDLYLIMNLFSQLTNYEPTHQGANSTLFSIDKTNYIIYHNEQAAEQKSLDNAQRHASTHYAEVVVPSPSANSPRRLGVPSPKQEPHVRHFLSCLQTLRTLLGAIQDKFNKEMNKLSISFWKAEHTLFKQHKKSKSICLPFFKRNKRAKVDIDDRHSMQLAIQQIVEPAFKSIAGAFHPSRRNIIQYLLTNLIDAYLKDFVAEPWIDQMTNDFFMLREFILGTPLLHSVERDEIRSYDCYRFFSMLVRTRMASLNQENPIPPTKTQPDATTPEDSPLSSAVTIDEFSSTTRSSYDHYSNPSHVHITMSQPSNPPPKGDEVKYHKPTTTKKLTMHSHTSSVDEGLSTSNSATMMEEEDVPTEQTSGTRRHSGAAINDLAFKPRILTHSASTDHLLRYNRVMPIGHHPLHSHHTSPNGVILTSK